MGGGADDAELLGLSGGADGEAEGDGGRVVGIVKRGKKYAQSVVIMF